ncbi:MAG: hypothetical protein WC393_03220 [Candidatus Nanoarchaeia archaeon]|jgi:hypothetical protein
MQLTAKLIILFFTLSLIPVSFSTTCYRTESYCSQYGTIEFNCRNENYNPHSCRVYGPHSVYVPQTCTPSCHYTQTCNFEYVYKCDYELIEVPCDYFSRYACYDYIPYNCGWREEMVCRDTLTCPPSYDCSYYETQTGWYYTTCYDTRTVCDTVTDYDKCITWDDKQVPYDCTEMKLNTYNISSSTGKTGQPILAAFSISECTGAITYELYLKNTNIEGTANCGLNTFEITPVSTGTQTVLLKLKDDRTAITKTIGITVITNINGEMDSLNPFIPGGEEFTNNIEAGNYNNKIIELINKGLSNDEIIKNLMLTVGAIGFAVTVSQANRIRNYIDSKRNKQISYSNPYGIDFDLFIKPNEELFKTNKELTIVQYKYNDENAGYLSKKFGNNKELMYTMIFDKNGNLVGAGSPDELKLTYLDSVNENNSGSLQERVADFTVQGRTYSFTPSLIVTNNYDSMNKLDSYYWSNIQRVQGTFDPNKEYEEQKPNNFALWTNFLFNFISLVGMFYGSAQQAKQNTQNYFSQLKYLSNSLNLINLGEGVIVNANGEIALDPIKALNNRQLLESLSIGLTYYPQLYTNEELLNIINGGYESVYELNLKMANNYLNTLNLDAITPSLSLTLSDSNFGDNSIEWNFKNGESDLMHEIGHYISEKIFNEGTSLNYNFDWEARADAISYKIYGNNYKIMAVNELELDYSYILDTTIDDVDKLIYDYFLAEKFQASEYVLDNIKELLASKKYSIEDNYVQSKLNGFESEWNMQEYLMRSER